MNVALIERLKKSEADLSGDSSFNFINVGAFRKEKNHKNLIEAFNKIRHLNVRLFLLGHRFLKDELILKVKKLQLESQIIFLDFDTNPFKYLSKCNCFVLSSDFEGFPNALLEAMVCGLPVISTDCLSGPREILAPDTDPVATVKDHIEITEYGILVPVKNSELLAEAMELIVKDKELHAKLRQKARERSLDFESGKIIEQYTDAIESL
jgi:N-acetylgalactosamine-N,N'-diacetylbacillosaminyl-diphospho-undecaprenol 4-alpha-N-acetylgalactosaminyltransferase